MKFFSHSKISNISLTHKSSKDLNIYLAYRANRTTIGTSILGSTKPSNTLTRTSTKSKPLNWWSFITWWKNSTANTKTSGTSCTPKFRMISTNCILLNSNSYSWPTIKRPMRFSVQKWNKSFSNWWKEDSGSSRIPAYWPFSKSFMKNRDLIHIGLKTYSSPCSSTRPESIQLNKSARFSDSWWSWAMR